MADSSEPAPDSSCLVATDYDDYSSSPISASESTIFYLESV